MDPHVLCIDGDPNAGVEGFRKGAHNRQTSVSPRRPTRGPGVSLTVTTRILRVAGTYVCRTGGRVPSGRGSDCSPPVTLDRGPVLSPFSVRGDHPAVTVGLPASTPPTYS